MLESLKRLFGFAAEPPVGRPATSYELEKLCRELPGAEYGIEPVEIVDEARLKEFLAAKRRGEALWRNRTAQEKAAASQPGTAGADRGGEHGRGA